MYIPHIIYIYIIYIHTNDHEPVRVTKFKMTHNMRSVKTCSPLM